MCQVGKSDKREACCECKEGDVCYDCLWSAALESEMNARQFTPFEFTAQSFNESHDPEGMWEAYDAGVASGVKQGMKARMLMEQSVTPRHANKAWANKVHTLQLTGGEIAGLLDAVERLHSWTGNTEFTKSLAPVMAKLMATRHNGHLVTDKHAEELAVLRIRKES